jgi:hypothetical protein
MDDVTPAIPPAAMAARMNARRFMIEPDSFPHMSEEWEFQPRMKKNFTNGGKERNE